VAIGLSKEKVDDMIVVEIAVVFLYCAKKNTTLGSYEVTLNIRVM